MSSLSLLHHATTRLSSIHGFSRSLTTTITPAHSIYVSKSTNPYFNLTFEDWLFRHKPPKEPLLLLYRDHPCVVIGRNQNPWKEVNFRALHRSEIPFIRRRSGGGTVYHDLGNTNFSIHVPRTTFDRSATAQIILRAVSGSAYKIVINRAYHHGTMLISTRLDTLGDLLRSNKESMITKGVASVRSPVCNLQQFSSTISHNVFVDAVVHEFRNEFDISEQACMIGETDELMRDDYIRKGMEELPSWEWAYGQTPEFEYKITRSFAWGDVAASILSKHGIILSCSIDVLKGGNIVLNHEMSEIGKRLEGKRYGQIEDSEVIGARGQSGDILQWLQQEMEV